MVKQLLFGVSKQLMKSIKGYNSYTRNCFVETAILVAGEISLKAHMQHPVIRSWVVKEALETLWVGGEGGEGKKHRIDQ